MGKFKPHFDKWPLNVHLKPFNEVLLHVVASSSSKRLILMNSY